MTYGRPNETLWSGWASNHFQNNRKCLFWTTLPPDFYCIQSPFRFFWLPSKRSPSPGPLLITQKTKPRNPCQKTSPSPFYPLQITTIRKAWPPSIKSLAIRNMLSYSCTMPTVIKIDSFRFHFYSDEGNEPPHIHIATPDGECKFWLQPIRLARNKGLSPLTIRKIEKLVFENQILLVGKYNESRNK